MNRCKLWSILCVVLVLALLVTMGGLTALVDPYFHYHGPVAGLEYPLSKQRYQNDGIARHFDYDAIITGTSLAENFKNSEFDALFGTNSVKLCYSGGTFSELTSNLRKALKATPDTKLVLFAIDEWFLASGRALFLADGDHPTYLYDDSIWNDVKYLLNKETFLTDTLGTLTYTAAGNTTTSFDTFGSWELSTGREPVMENYNSMVISAGETAMTPEERENLVYNMQTVLVELAQEYPDTEFIYFFPPYSVVNWYLHVRERSVGCFVDAFRMATEILLQQENIRLFSFYTDFATITDLDNYRDVVHYGSSINSLLLKRIAAGEYELTLENYQAHWQEVEAFYTNYDYDALLAGAEA